MQGILIIINSNLPFQPCTVSAHGGDKAEQPRSLVRGKAVENNS